VSGITGTVPLMRQMRIEAIYRRPSTSQPAPGHRIYPYLAARPRHHAAQPGLGHGNHLPPHGAGLVYRAAVVDWFSPRVLAWKLSIIMETSFCVEALDEALSRNEKPEFFNTDQGSQFTSEAYTGRLKENGIGISMDGKGRWRDNFLVKSIWLI
jgi:putative transposase